MRPALDATGFVDCLRKTVKLRGESFGRASLSIGAAYSALAQYGSNRFYRPTPEILAGIATHWPKDQSIPLITAHLQDEIKRATLDPAQFTIAYYVSKLAKSSDIQAIEFCAEWIALERDGRICVETGLVGCWRVHGGNVARMFQRGKPDVA